MRKIYMYSIIGFGILLFLFSIISSPLCAEGTYIPPICSGDTIIQKQCHNGRWQLMEVQTCKNLCRFGVCTDIECEEEYKCRTPFSAVMKKCEGGKPKYELKICGEKEYCVDGDGCVPSPPTCGNGVCDWMENEISCIRDCGAISSWQSYFFMIPADIQFQYTQCNDIFDCNSPEVENAVREMETTCQFSNPREWIECASQWIYNRIVYDFSGGERQCGESASDVLRSGKGNCVDMSTLFIAMARYRGIPARHVGVCLSHRESWKCQTFSLIRPTAQIQLGYITGLKAGEDAQPLGHALAEVYNPSINGWSFVDPTSTGLGLIKECYGYSPVLEYAGPNGQVCYISNYNDITYCTTF